MNRNLKASLLVLLTVCFVGCGSQINESTTSEEVVSEQVSNVENTDVVDKLTNSAETQSNDEMSPNGGKVIKLTTAEFINKVYDYKANPSKWVYKGKRHAVIDFYADWCGPCKRVAPIMDKLAKQYDGQIDFYKINTDEESELSGAVFGIRSIPSILFIPANGQPSMHTGAFPEEDYIKIINEQLLK